MTLFCRVRRLGWSTVLSTFLAAILVLPALAPSATFAQSPELCANGIDDDGDGAVDCADLDCLDFGYFDGGQEIGTSSSIDVALGDLDGDGDLDAWVANHLPGADRVWLNDGFGNFVDSGQALGTTSSLEVALGDLDGDGDLDAWVAKYIVDSADSEPNQVWFNDGAGNFTESAQTLGNRPSAGVALADFDGDGDLDAWVANIGEGPSESTDRIWLNDGAGGFTESSQFLGSWVNYGVAIGDLDGDGDLDAYTPTFGPFNGMSNLVWFNDGTGDFIFSGQRLGSSESFGASLGDLDGDGDLDAFVTNFGVGSAGQPNRIWLNDGGGTFTDSGQLLGDSHSYRSVLGDLDGDGDLDAWVTNFEADRVWLNDGTGGFSSHPLLGGERNIGVDLGDLDGDGDLDVFAAKNDMSGDALPTGNRVWFNVLSDCPDVLLLRGDGNGDGVIDLADPIFNLTYQFSLGPTICLDAQDSNDDGAVDVADPVYTLGFLFASGSPPPAPFSSCGVDPTPDALDCGGTVFCP